MLRPLRMAKLIKEEVSNILCYDIKDERINKFISVTRVEVSRDLRYATIYLSIYNPKEEAKEDNLNVLNVINHAKGFIRQLLSKRIRAKFIPQLNFKLDYSIEVAIKLNKLCMKQNV